MVRDHSVPREYEPIKFKFASGCSHHAGDRVKFKLCSENRARLTGLTHEV
jgi:hypothetical protein